MIEGNGKGDIEGEALSLLVGLLRGKLVGTEVDMRIHLSKYGFGEKKKMLKSFIEEERIASGAKAEALAEYYLNRI